MKFITKISTQRGVISTEYILATLAILAMLFGLTFDETPLWQILIDALQSRHDSYTQTISNLDMVDVKSDKQ